MTTNNDYTITLIPLYERTTRQQLTHPYRAERDGEVQYFRSLEDALICCERIDDPAYQGAVTSKHERISSMPASQELS